MIRSIQILLYACAFLLVAGLAFKGLFRSGGESSSGHPYANLWISYSIKNQGILEPKIGWLIATSAQPKVQSHRGEDGMCTFTFHNDRSFTVKRDSNHLIWIDPDSGVRMIPTALTEDQIDRIQNTKNSISGMKFNSGEELLAWIDGTDAQQAAPSNR